MMQPYYNAVSKHVRGNVLEGCGDKLFSTLTLMEFGNNKKIYWGLDKINNFLSNLSYLKSIKLVGLFDNKCLPLKPVNV